MSFEAPERAFSYFYPFFSLARVFLERVPFGSRQRLRAPACALSFSKSTFSALAISLSLSLSLALSLSRSLSHSSFLNTCSCTHTRILSHVVLFPHSFSSSLTNTPSPHKHYILSRLLSHANTKHTRCVPSPSRSSFFFVCLKDEGCERNLNWFHCNQKLRGRAAWLKGMRSGVRSLVWWCLCFQNNKIIFDQHNCQTLPRLWIIYCMTKPIRAGLVSGKIRTRVRGWALRWDLKPRTV